MHEFGYCDGILEAVTRRAAGRPVAEVTVHIGADHRIEEEALAQAFQMVAEGTVAAGATIVLHQPPGADIMLESIRLHPAAEG